MDSKIITIYFIIFSKEKIYWHIITAYYIIIKMFKRNKEKYEKINNYINYSNFLAYDGMQQ